MSDLACPNFSHLKKGPSNRSSLNLKQPISQPPRIYNLDVALKKLSKGHPTSEFKKVSGHLSVFVLPSLSRLSNNNHLRPQTPSISQISSKTYQGSSSCI